MKDQSKARLILSHFYHTLPRGVIKVKVVFFFLENVIFEGDQIYG